MHDVHHPTTAPNDAPDVRGRPGRKSRLGTAVRREVATGGGQPRAARPSSTGCPSAGPTARSSGGLIRKTTLDDLFVIERSPRTDGQACSDDRRRPRGPLPSASVKDGVDPMRGFALETGASPPCSGATTEFRKDEGITYDPSTFFRLHQRDQQRHARSSGPADSLHKAGTTNPGHPERLWRRRLPGRRAVRARHPRKRDPQPVRGPHDGGRSSPAHPSPATPKNTCDKEGIANPDNITSCRASTASSSARTPAPGTATTRSGLVSTRGRRTDPHPDDPVRLETTSVYWYPDSAASAT